jgi:hypothetical protein
MSALGSLLKRLRLPLIAAPMFRLQTANGLARAPHAFSSIASVRSVKSGFSVSWRRVSALG